MIADMFQFLLLQSVPFSSNLNYRIRPISGFILTWSTQQMKHGSVYFSYPFGAHTKNTSILWGFLFSVVSVLHVLRCNIVCPLTFSFRYDDVSSFSTYELECHFCFFRLSCSKSQFKLNVRLVEPLPACSLNRFT